MRAEIALDTSQLAEHIRKEWDSLQANDVVYLLEVRSSDEVRAIGNGHTANDTARLAGLARLRTASVVQILDENGRPIRDRASFVTNSYVHKSGQRKLILNIDAIAYKVDEDRKSKGKADIYETINVIIRRKGRENNFNRILESIKSLALADIPVPGWFQEVFLGYGNPAGANYTQLESRFRKLDFRDTFINWEHLVESLPNKVRKISMQLSSVTDAIVR